MLCGLLALLVSTLAPAQGTGPGQVPVAGIYTCVDGKGRKLTSDRPIADCLDREQKLLNPSGTVRAKVGPTLTAQERADAEAREKQEAEARALQAEEKRRERALLTRYPTREVHDRERALAFTQVAAIAQAARKRIDELLSERRMLDQEMEFYKKDPSRAPASLRRQLQDIDQGILVQERFIGEQQNELKRISTRFDEELERLKPLWALQRGSGPSAVTGSRKPN
jgi:hypothetical protein